MAPFRGSLLHHMYRDMYMMHTGRDKLVRPILQVLRMHLACRIGFQDSRDSRRKRSGKRAQTGLRTWRVGQQLFSRHLQDITAQRTPHMLPKGWQHGRLGDSQYSDSQRNSWKSMRTLRTATFEFAALTGNKYMPPGFTIEDLLRIYIAQAPGIGH